MWFHRGTKWSLELYPSPFASLKSTKICPKTVRFAQSSKWSLVPGSSHVSTSTRQVQWFLLKPVHSTKAQWGHSSFSGLKISQQIPSHSICPSHLCFLHSERQSLPVCHTAFWPILLSKSIHKGHSSSSCPSRNSGHPGHRLQVILFFFPGRTRLHPSYLIMSTWQSRCSSPLVGWTIFKKSATQPSLCQEYLSLTLDISQAKVFLPEKKVLSPKAQAYKWRSKRHPTEILHESSKPLGSPLWSCTIRSAQFATSPIKHFVKSEQAYSFSQPSYAI